MEVDVECVVLTRCVAAVCGGTVTVWPVSGQLAAPSSHADGGGRYAASLRLAPVYGGSWISLAVGLSDCPPWCVEVCDKEMEKDGGWTGRVKADCLSVMNINGLQIPLLSYGSPLWDGGSPSSLPLTLAALYKHTNTHLNLQHYSSFV